MGEQPFDGWADASLVEAARGGDLDAFGELIARHRGTALTVVGRLLRSHDLAGDAVQEASLLAMTGLERLRSPERFGAWLCGIALNVARRWLRELQRTPFTAVPARPEDSVGPDEYVEVAEIAARVRRAVAGLADGQRDAVLLFYLQGLTHREVAAELAISVGAVKARLHQARAALAPRLASLIEPEEAPSMPDEQRDEQPDEHGQWIEVSVTEVRRDGGDEATRRHVIVLSELHGDRELPIWVGPFEATAVALSLEATEMPRPMTYQFSSNLVTATGCRVGEVRITGLASGIFYATVVIEGAATPAEVESRPSDAINLALVTGAPIRVARRLLDDPNVTDRPEWPWRHYSQATAEIAVEMEQLLKRDLAPEAAKRTTGTAVTQSLQGDNP